MKHCNPAVMLVAFGSLALAACGGGGDAPAETEAAEPGAADAVLENGMTVGELIELRQEKFEDLGGTFRAINQELRASEPDLAKLQEAAASVPGITEGIADWFPEGTGPEAGVETEALPTIWETPEDYATKIADYVAAADALAEAAAQDDIEVIRAAVQATGATCGACHDVYRVDD